MSKILFSLSFSNPLIWQEPSVPGLSYLFCPSIAHWTPSYTRLPRGLSKRLFCRCGLTTGRNGPCSAATYLITRHSLGRKCGLCRRTATASTRVVHRKRQTQPPSSRPWRMPTMDTMTLPCPKNSSKSSIQYCQYAHRSKQRPTHSCIPTHSHKQMNSCKCHSRASWI